MTAWDEVRKRCPRLYRKFITFECGLGWVDLILDLSLKIEKILLQMAEEGNAESIDMYALQVKEKYGTLRFYMSSQTKEIMDLIYDAEAKSSQTCELCGELGKMRPTNWITALCDECFKKSGEKNECRVSLCRYV